MSTPADQGDTRPTDHERLLVQQLWRMVADATDDVRAEAGDATADMLDSLLVTRMRALLAACAPAPPDAGQALRDAVKDVDGFIAGLREVGDLTGLAAAATCRLLLTSRADRLATDRERLTEAEREVLREVVWPIDPPRSDPGSRLLHGRIEAAVESILAARAPAPPDAAQALRDAAQAELDQCAGDWNGTVCDRCKAVASRLRRRADRLAAPEPDAATRTVTVEDVLPLLDAVDRAARLSGRAAEHPEALSIRDEAQRLRDRLRAAAAEGGA